MRKPDIRWAITIVVQTTALVFAVSGNIYAERLFAAWCVFGVIVSLISVGAVVLSDKTFVKKDSMRSAWASKADAVVDFATVAVLVAVGWFWIAAMYGTGSLLCYLVIADQRGRLAEEEKGGETK